MSLVKGGEIPKPNTKHANLSKIIVDGQVKHNSIRREIRTKVECLAAEIVNEYIQRKPYRGSLSEFNKFPSNELARAFKIN